MYHTLDNVLSLLSVFPFIFSIIGLVIFTTVVTYAQLLTNNVQNVHIFKKKGLYYIKLSTFTIKYKDGPQNSKSSA